jgi:hypothetical protein
MAFKGSARRAARKTYGAKAEAKKKDKGYKEFYHKSAFCHFLIGNHSMGLIPMEMFLRKKKALRWGRAF